MHRYKFFIFLFLDPADHHSVRSNRQEESKVFFVVLKLCDRVLFLSRTIKDRARATRGANFGPLALKIDA